MVIQSFSSETGHNAQVDTNIPTTFPTSHCGELNTVGAVGRGQGQQLSTAILPRTWGWYMDYLF